MPTVDKTKYYTRAFIFQTIKDESGGTTNRRININVDTCDNVFTPEHKLYSYNNN